MNVITIKDLNALVSRINKMTNSPECSYKRVSDKSVGQVGNYCLDSAYGGHSLIRICNESGGCTSIISGFHSKRDLYNRMQAFISGLQCAVQS